MPDSHALPSPTATRGSNLERQSSPRGLPLLSTAPLTAKERTALHDLERALRTIADRVADALQANRVTFALDACTAAGEIGLAAARAASVIGSGR